MSGTLVPRSLDVDPDVSLVEVPVSHRQDEARAAFKVVDSLLESGVSKREILVVAGTLQEYEPGLGRAAIRRGLTPTFWTQLDLVTTQLYRLLHGTCDLLGADRLIVATDLQSVLVMGWTPPDPDGNVWPMAQIEVVNVFEGVSPNTQHTLGKWRDVFASSEDDDRVRALLDWLDKDHTATPSTVEAVLHDLIDRYRELVLPRVMADDVPALLDTETAARATVRMESVVEQVAAKYRARRNASRIPASWTSVASLIESVSSQAPGRREHANARAVDVMEPNDVWPRQAEYVLVVGLVESEWPTPTESLVPAELRDAINTGTDGTESIVPRPSWTAGRAADQFAEVLDAATEGVVLFRHTQSAGGEAVLASSLVDMVPASTVDDRTREQLLRETMAEPGELLDAIGLTDSQQGDHE